MVKQTNPKDNKKNLKQESTIEEISLDSLDISKLEKVVAKIDKEQGTNVIWALEKEKGLNP